MSISKCAVITGVSRGLGRSMVEEFVAQGWTVGGAARDVRAIAALRQSYSAPHHFMEADMRSCSSIRLFAETILAKVGTPTLLLNNAAVINNNAPLWEVSEEDFSELIDINIKGVAACIRHFVPAMIQAKRGIIINFSSGWGRSTSPEVAPYCASKWAIEGLSAALAEELPKGLASAAFNPGVINTDMLQSCLGESAAGYATAAEWAKTAVPFLSSLDASCNGSQLTSP